MNKFTLYRDPEGWIPFVHWFWLKTGETGTGQGPYTRLGAFIRAWLATRSSS